ncbi:hypothetical protein HG430_002945 [Candidatus Gracilibacteria bacterium]|nr:hypothetical protein [Candidatus Gracilibacteria bacterium]
MPVKGGTISEGIIGNFPSLNPIVPLYSDGNDKYIIQLLYRSLLKYDIEKHQFVGDIAKCDISSMVNIECIINEDAKWSNGENITTEDLVATYQLIKETGSNKILVSLLQSTEIETRDNNTIIFKNTRKDTNFLNVFLQPILNKKFIDTLSKENITGKFPVNGGIYSGRFVIEKVSEDENLGITKLTLQKNEFYDKSNISKIVINIFPDINSFKKNHQAVNVFNDTDNNIGNTIPRFQAQKYTLNSFVGVFLNQNKITSTDLRYYILNKLDTSKLIKVLGEQNYKVINNPFLSEDNISQEPKNKNFDSVMKSIGYKKKSVFLQELTPKAEEKKEEVKQETKPEVKPEEKKPDEITIPADLTLDRFQKDSKLISSPDYVDIYNFITKDDVLLRGSAPENVTAVYVNDYKLANFKSGDRDFYYRLRENIGNLKAGMNSYKIYFEIGGEKKLQEELFFVYYHDKDKLKEEEKKLAESLYRKEMEAKIAKENQEKKETPPVPAPAPETPKAPEQPKNQEQLDKINKLDENLYYNKDLQAFSLKLYYINDGKKETTDTVNFIENSLKELGITVVSSPFDLKDLAKIMSNKDEYDMILAGIHLGYLNSNLFPYLHSSQAKTGYNFSNIRKTSLDLLVEELKENIYTEEKTLEIEKKVLDILRNEQVLKTLYTPKINLLVDKNIKIEKAYSSLPYKSERSSILENAYIKEEKILDLTDKSFIGFFKFLLEKLYE